MVRFGWTLSWRAHRQGECWFMPEHKSDVWRVWLHRIYGDGRVEQLIWLAVPVLNMCELSPLWLSVLLLLLYLSSGVHVQSALPSSAETTLIYIYLYLSFTTASEGPSTAPTLTWSTAWWPRQPRVRGTPIMATPLLSLDAWLNQNI